ncbi:unnamed protein product [Medioppia subpectinata]|uniref:Disks large homolog 5 n=1 Tax=Medioppia subpectinata TaxID=1979941 RepID=A0A7R9KK74_9ACAR|nr:unnamed protein product [Medioppia subpectinata]CAG2104840.1 unnamed protein product [Medioppia subpectinata]
MATNEHNEANNPYATLAMTGNDTIQRHYQTLFRKYETLKDDHESLRKRYSDLVGSHGDYVSKLESAQEESYRNRKSFEESIQERNLAIIERNGLKQQCTQAIRQWDKALREINELKEQLSKVQHQRDEALKEINHAMSLRIKAAKDMTRLTEERNAAHQEYSLIMSERDSVHKEIEKLQEEQQTLLRKTKQLEAEKKTSVEEIESLKREISSALFDRDRVLKACNDLREKYGDYVTGIHDDVHSPRSPHARSGGHNFWGSSSSGVSTSWAQAMSRNTNLVLSAASSNSSMSTFSHPQTKQCSTTRLDNIDQANSEIESLRKQVERLQTDLAEAQQEVEVCKRRRDWAFNERDKIVLERESIRTLCDKLRRERDRAVSDLAEALRESDDIKRQKNEATKELKELKEKFEGIKLERDPRPKSHNNSQLGTNNSSRDSAIEADLQEYEMETMTVSLKRELKSNEWGFTIRSDDKTVCVDKVMKDSVADGKLVANDILLKLNETSINNDLKVATDLLKKNDLQLILSVQRKRVTRFVQNVTISVEKGQELGLEIESGYYVSRINAGSVAAKEGNIAVGDRVISINDKTYDEKTVYEVMQILESMPNIVLQIMKNNSNVCSQSNSNSSIVNASKGSSESTDSKPNHRERQRKMVSTQTDNFLAQQNTPKPPVPSVYQPINSRTNEETNPLVSSANKSAMSSFANSYTSSSVTAHDVKPTSPPAPTLLDKAYNKIYGERKLQNSKTKQIHGFCEDETKTLAELDKVLDKYSNGKTYEKNTKYVKSGKSSKKEKNGGNGGTWPKYRGHPPVPNAQNYGNVNAVMTLHPIKRKERKSLGIFTNIFTKSEKSPPESKAMAQQPPTKSAEDNQCLSNSIKDEGMTPSSFLIFEPASEAHLKDYERNTKRNSTHSSRPSTLQSIGNQKPIYLPNGQSFNGNKMETLDLKIYHPLKTIANSALDYSVVSAQSKDKNVLDYYKHRTNAKQLRPHSVHDVLTDVTQPVTSNTLAMTADHSSYDSFQAPTASSPPPNSAPIPPIRNPTSYAYYALNNISHPPSALHIHHNHYSATQPLTRGVAQPSVRHSTSPQSLISPFISRSGDSLLSGNDSQMHSHDLSHSRSVSAYQGGVRPYTVKDNLVNRYSITPSPSPSQYSSGLFGGPSPSHSMDIITPVPSGAHFLHSINQTKRMVAPQHTHQSHLHHSSINNTGVYRSDDNNLGLPSFDGLSTFPKRNQRFRIPSNQSVTSKSSTGKLSTSSIDKASSSILSDRGSPMPCAYHIDWVTPLNGSSNGVHRIAKPGDVRNISIERSSAPSMGINIAPSATGGVFVCHVNENSLAAQAGLLVGDQLLEICGINMRNATYKLAANVLRQCGNNILMMVQYNPDKYDEDNDSDDVDADEDDDMEDEDADDTAANDSTSTSTPQSSPMDSKPLLVRANTASAAIDANIPSSTNSTLTRSKAASRSASNASRNTEKTLTDYSIRERQSSFKQSSNVCDPRRIVVKKPSNLGISLFGGNAVGIFIHSVRDDSLASGSNGLKPGDQILEYNGVDLRNATAEEAAIELAKPAETITLVAQYNMERFKEIQDQHTGDSFFIRAAFDRPSVDGSLAFRKEEILFVDNTMFNGVPGLWRAWLVDQEGQKVKCGVIPSKYKVEEELLMKRSLTDSTGESGSRGATSARRSFFRRRKSNHQRSSSRESTRELASFSDVSINSFSESGAITAETDYNCQLLPTTYVRVERLSYKTTRPVIVIGPLQEVLSIKLEQDFQTTFKRCVPEIMKGSQQMMERWLQDLKLVDYRRDYRGSQGSHFECITVAAVKEICDKNLHALLEVSPTSVERLIKCQIYPVVVYLKFKSTKQIKEIKDHRYPNEKLTTKAAKEMFEHSLKIESQYKHLINVVIPGSNLSYMCTQVKTCVEEEQNKALWI